MAEIRFSMWNDVLNTLVDFTKAFVDTKSRMVQLRNVHCVAHGSNLEVTLVNNNAAAKVVLPILDEIKDGTEFDITVPKKVDTRVDATVTFIVDTESGRRVCEVGNSYESTYIESGVFPNIDKYWDEREGVRKIGLNPALLLNALKAFDKKKPVELLVTNAKEPLFITQGDSKKCFILPVVMRGEG